MESMLGNLLTPPKSKGSPYGEKMNFFKSLILIAQIKKNWGKNGFFVKKKKFLSYRIYIFKSSALQRAVNFCLAFSVARRLI